MSKGLECLEKIANADKSIERDIQLIKGYPIIKKELKALEIIKKKKISVFFLCNHFNEDENLEEYNFGLKKEYKLTQEEFNLLKEVLADD